MAFGSLGGGIYTEGRWLWTGLEPIREREVAGVVSGSASQWVGGRHTSMKMVPTEVTETSTLSIHTPGNYPKEENTRCSQHGESLKTRLILRTFESD
jgi:hypothetical protein